MNEFYFHNVTYECNRILGIAWAGEKFSPHQTWKVILEWIIMNFLENQNIKTEGQVAQLSILLLTAISKIIANLTYNSCLKQQIFGY